MPQPDVRGSLVAGPLSNISIAYRNPAYIAKRLFRTIQMENLEQKIARYLKGAWFRDEAGPMGPGSRAKRGGYPTDYLTASVELYGFAKEVTDYDRDASKGPGAPPLNLDQDAVEFANEKVDLNLERRVATAVIAGTWSGVAGEDVEGLWAAGAGNTFITDVETRIETIRANTGRRPNVLMLTANTLKEVKQESTVLDRIKYTERGIVSAPLIAALFDLEEVIIAEAIVSTAAEKADGTDFTAQDIWEKNAGKGSAFLCYRPPRMGLKTPAAACIPLLRFAGSGLYRETRRWREEAEHQDVYEVTEKNGYLQTGPDMGFLWYDTILT